ncbi:hypothetical protein Vadar_007751 [Vaccinium darrowii]|uniref:Uncharacterized protein n=1 Tax=Vaccinium darrowii TaxID=229202 RepID=A0ACB7XNY5_9ERIC|nr:hypothetical protein Vadar_007751 [Vaccinium darrowii]
MEAATVPPPPQRRKKTQDHSNTTTTTISDLPSHITCDVLSRLPLNSIFYCKRLCSSFRNPTLEPYFPQLHLPKSPFSLILYRPSDFEHPIFGYLPLDDSLVDLHRRSRWTMKFEAKIIHPTCFEFLSNRIVSSCNGLILLSDAKWSNNVCVCNPITRQHFFLPKPDEDLCLLRRGRYFYCGYGFGYSRSTDLFKVVKFTANYKEQPYRLHCCVYTLGVDDEWRTLGSTRQPVPYNPDLPFVFLNGALHWISWERSTWLLCYFDMEKEQCGNQTFRLHSKKLNLSAVPSSLEGTRFHLGVVDNCLYIRDEQTSPLPVNIWVMKDYGDIRSWNLEWIIQRPLPSGLNQDLKPVKTLEDGTVLMTVRKKVLASYNPVTKVLQRVSYHGVQFWEDLIVGVLSFLPLPCKNHQLKLCRS